VSSGQFSEIKLIKILDEKEMKFPARIFKSENETGR